MSHIEYHSENGSSPWVVMTDVPGLEGVVALWLAYQTAEQASQKLLGEAVTWGKRFDGLNDSSLLEVLGDDASKWARAFVERNPAFTNAESLMVTWFANAIEHSSHVRDPRRTIPARTAELHV